MSKITENLEQFIFWAITGLVAALASGLWWLIRQIFTNQEQIELLQLDLKSRDKQREEDRERMTRIEDGIETIRKVLMEWNDRES